MSEKPKRLEPTKETLRELFAKSGNQCAFDGCSNLIINNEGAFIAQVCHIEAAEQGGERFRGDMTNEERRHVSNLMLMCYEHHVVTNDVHSYPVKRLKAMKAAHEARFVDASEIIWKAITDHSAAEHAEVAITLQRLHDELGWGLHQEHLQETAAILVNIQQRIKQLPKDTRQLLAIIVARSGEPHGPQSFMSVSHEELKSACKINAKHLISQVNILVKYGLAMSDHDEMHQPQVLLLPAGDNWPFWKDIKKFCKKAGVSLDELIVNQNFSLLDRRPD